MPNLAKFAEAASQVLEEMLSHGHSDAQLSATAHIAEEVHPKAPGAGLSKATEQAETASQITAKATEKESVAAGTGSETAESLVKPRLPLDEASTKDVLEQLLSHNPAALARLRHLWPNHQFSETALKLFRADPHNAELLERELTNGTTPYWLINERVHVLAQIRKQLDSITFDGVLALEKEHWEAIQRGIWPELTSKQGQQLVTRLVQEGAPPEHFYRPHLRARMRLEEILGPDSPSLRRVLDLEATDGLKLENVVRLKNGAFITQLLESENPVQRLNELGDHDAPFAKLAEAIGENDVALSKAADIAVSGGPAIERLNGFINDSFHRADVAADVLERGVSAHLLKERLWLPGFDLVKRHLGSDPELLAQATEYSEQGTMSLWKVGSYLDGDPSARSPAIERLLKDKTPERANDLIHLAIVSPACC